MKNTDYGQIAQVLANFSVFAGIVFLALELQQNNEDRRVREEVDLVLPEWDGEQSQGQIEGLDDLNNALRQLDDASANSTQ